MTSLQIGRRPLMILVAALAAWWVVFFVQGATPVFAHAAYSSSVPAANTTVKTDPTKVSITFLQNLSPQGLDIKVYDNKGIVVSTGTVQIEPQNPKAASVMMMGDGSDIYRVDWQNVSAEDNDPTLGAFVFAVDPSGKSDKVASTLASPSTGGTDNTPLVATLAALIGLVVGAGGSYFWLNRARPAQS